MTLNRIVTRGADELVTLDARQPHPGFDPFRRDKARRAARDKLRSMDLTLAEQVAVTWALNGCTLPADKQLSDELADLVRLAREGE
jgi:hypothetical protein